MHITDLIYNLYCTKIELWWLIMHLIVQCCQFITFSEFCWLESFRFLFHNFHSIEYHHHWLCSFCNNKQQKQLVWLKLQVCHIQQLNTLVVYCLLYHGLYLKNTNMKSCKMKLRSIRKPYTISNGSWVAPLHVIINIYLIFVKAPDIIVDFFCYIQLCPYWIPMYLWSLIVLH